MKLGASIIIGVVCGIAFPIVGGKMTTKIKFSYSFLDWVSTMFLAYMAYMMIFCIECVAATVAGDVIPESNILFKIVRLFFANGFLVPICSILLSVIFEKIVESYNLDYFEYYSAKVAQICFAAFSIALFVCIMNNLSTITEGTDIDGTTEFMVSRLIV